MSDSRTQPGIVRAFLRAPLIWKILLANSVFVGIAFYLAEQAGSVAALVLSLALTGIGNAVLVAVALTPIRRLERVAERIAAGDRSARAEVSPVADADLVRMTRLFNAALDASEAYVGDLKALGARQERTEKRRATIATLLHEDIAQRLAAVLLQLKAVGAPEELRTEIASLMEDVRNAAGVLSPTALAGLGIAAAARVEARRLEESDIDVDLEVDVTARGARQAELALYRALQEAISNIDEHAGATKARIRIRTARGRVRATIADNGVGFDSTAQLRAVGLLAMAEGMARLGGTATVRPRLGRGTVVKLEVPLSSWSE